MISVRQRVFRFMIGLIASVLLSPSATAQRGNNQAAKSPELVFVSRQIPRGGSVYWDLPNDMPGVGPHSRFRVAAPGRLMVLDSRGQARVIVDGSHPTEASRQLIDVNAPDVSYDGRWIVFAGYAATGAANPGDANRTSGNPGNWRLYIIRNDGTGLRQITFSDQKLDLSQFGDAAGQFQAYDDTDPAWLPDGRIVFSSTRYPTLAHYSGVRATNLYVINADGTDMHRITAERNGADRPVVDPITGRIVYARWWRNHRFADDRLDTVTDGRGGYIRKDGLTTDRYDHVGGGDHLWRNQWHAAAINPDGTALTQWSAGNHRMDASHCYGGVFTKSGDYVANYFPMHNMTEAGGFGGLRFYTRRSPGYTPLAGSTSLTLDYRSTSNPTSYGIFKGSFASDAVVLPDGRYVISWARDIDQDYDLYLFDPATKQRTLLWSGAGTTELRAKFLGSRALPPVLKDTVSRQASLLPPKEGARPDADGTFVFDALNVYFNGPVDSIESNAPAVGSAASIRFFMDTQRTSPGSFPNRDWPVLLGEMRVNPDGSVRDEQAPANVSLFEQIRNAANRVPLTGGAVTGAAHVAGLNFGRPGQVMRCVGCHAGHTAIPVPETAEEAKWTNLAPSAVVRVSSSRDPNLNGGLIDRRVKTGEIWRYWNSAPGAVTNQWVELEFPVPVVVRTVRLYNPRFGEEANSSLQVEGSVVKLFRAPGDTVESARESSGPLAVSGTDVRFPDVTARRIRVEITSVSGTFYGARLASLAEVEVIAKGSPQ